MTAPVRIEACAWTDIRYQALAIILSLPDRDVALIRCATIWRWQTEHYTEECPTYEVSRAVVIGALGSRGPEAIIEADLATLEPDGRFRIRGGRDANGMSRIDWLWRHRSERKSGGRSRAMQAGKDGRAGGKFVVRPLGTSTAPAGDQQATSTAPTPDQERPADNQVSVSVSVYDLSLRGKRSKSAREGAMPATSRRTTIPGEWIPTPEHQAKAAALGVDVDDQADRFKIHHGAKGSLFVDWDLAFHTWLRNARDFSRQWTRREGSGNLDRQLARIIRLEADDGRKST